MMRIGLIYTDFFCCAEIYDFELAKPIHFIRLIRIIRVPISAFRCIYSASGVKY
jgi:hypothetical protein